MGIFDIFANSLKFEYASVNEQGEGGGPKADELLGEDLSVADRQRYVDHVRAYVQEAADGELSGEDAAVQSGVPGFACVEPG
jgi:hypothetical protein